MKANKVAAEIVAFHKNIEALPAELQAELLLRFADHLLAHEFALPVEVPAMIEEPNERSFATAHSRMMRD